MKNMLRPAAALVVVTLVGLGVACSSAPPKGAKPTPTPEPMAVSTPTVVTVDTPTPAPTTAPRQPQLPTSVKEINDAGYLKAVFFEFDKYDIRADQRDVLAADASWLQKWPTVQFTIEGHCDERGTREYNLALGDKRANAAKDYLVSLGVSAARIKTVSYGKERPFASGHDEDSWAKNRRAHFVVTAR